VKTGWLGNLELPLGKQVRPFPLKKVITTKKKMGSQEKHPICGQDRKLAKVWG